MYQPLPMHHSAHGGAADGEDTDGDDEFAEHLGLRHTISRAMVNEVKVDRPYAERLSVILEELAILGIITTYCVGAVKVSQESLHGVWGWLAGALPWVGDCLHPIRMILTQAGICPSAHYCSVSLYNQRGI